MGMTRETAQGLYKCYTGVFIYGYIHLFILLIHICVLIYLILKALHRAEMMYGFHIIGYQARVF